MSVRSTAETGAVSTKDYSWKGLFWVVLLMIRYFSSKLGIRSARRLIRSTEMGLRYSSCGSLIRLLQHLAQVSFVPISFFPMSPSHIYTHCRVIPGVQAMEMSSRLLARVQSSYLDKWRRSLSLLTLSFRFVTLPISTHQRATPGVQNRLQPRHYSPPSKGSPQEYQTYNSLVAASPTRRANAIIRASTRSSNIRSVLIELVYLPVLCFPTLSRQCARRPALASDQTPSLFLCHPIEREKFCLRVVDTAK